MNEYELIKGLTDLIKFTLAIQFFIIAGFILQFIANIVIISQLPKIKRYNKLIYLKLYGFEDNDDEEEDNEKSTYNYKFVENEEQKIKENINQDEEFHNLVESLGKENIELIILGILIGIIIIIVLFKFIL